MRRNAKAVLRGWTLLVSVVVTPYTEAYEFIINAFLSGMLIDATS